MNIRTTAFLAVPLAGAACIDYNPQAFPDWPPPNEPRHLGDDEQTDEIVQVTSPKADVLWMIDNSGSMGPYQEALTSNFPSFMAFFDGSGLDYHVGVTSSDLDGNYNGASGKLVTVAGVKFIDEDLEDPIGMFQAMATLGTSGSGTEQGTGAVFQALEMKRDTDNAGFWRDEASIHTVVISDEPDLTRAGSVDEFEAWYQSLKPVRDDRTFSSIVDPADGGAYLRLTANIGGVEGDINADDWDGLLSRLGVQAAGMKREYFLSRLPVESSIDVEVVTVDQLVLNQFVADVDWTYDPTRNSITFAEFVPDPLSTVVIHYTVLASVQENPEDPPEGP